MIISQLRSNNLFGKYFKKELFPRLPSVLWQHAVSFSHYNQTFRFLFIWLSSKPQHRSLRSHDGASDIFLRSVRAPQIKPHRPSSSEATPPRVSFALIMSRRCVPGRRCVPSSEKSRCCRSSIPRSAWRTPTWLRRWRPRGRPSGSVRGRTRSSTHTTRCLFVLVPVIQILCRTLGVKQLFVGSKLLFMTCFQELNNRLAAEITKIRSMTSEDGVGDTNAVIQGKELYELEVRLSSTKLFTSRKCFSFENFFFSFFPSGDVEGERV